MVRWLVLLMLVAPLAHAEIHLGDDPAGDDTVGPLGSGSTGYDTSNIDDVRAASIWTEGTDVKVRMTVESAASSTTHGQFCWMPAFQINGEETEYVGLICQTYTAGSGGAFAEANTNRGEEVASSAEWDGSSVIITMPFDRFGATLGDVMTDIYVMTYGPNQGQNGLYVDDALPDAKSDRNAAENLGCYVIGGVDESARTCEAPAADSGPVLLNVTGPTASWNGVGEGGMDHILNLTGFGANLTVAYDVDGAGNLTISANHMDDDGVGDSVTLTSGNGSLELMGPADGWQVLVSSDDFVGNVTLDFHETMDETPTAMDDDNGDPAPPGDEDQDEGSGNATTDGKDSPLPLAWALLAIILAKRRS